MDVQTWFFRITTSLDRLSDVAYQQRAWIERPGGSTSFVEALYQLYDEYDLAGFLERYVAPLPDAAEIAESFATLDDELGAIDDALPHAEVITSKAWARVMAAAKRSRELLLAKRDAILATHPAG